MSKHGEPPDVIYLLQTGKAEWVWSDDPAPGPHDDPDDAVKYIKWTYANEDKDDG